MITSASLQQSSSSLTVEGMGFPLFGRGRGTAGNRPWCTNAETTTLSAGLAKMQGQYGSEYPTMMAAATLAILPMVIIYVIFQKQFVEGIATSGGKL